MRAPIARPNLLWRGFVFGGVGTLKVLSLSDTAWDWWEENVTDAIPRSAVRGLLGGTVALHVAEAAVARRWARRAGLEHRGAWMRTTALYGFPELRHLRRAIRAEQASR
jgi:hypothetical protein